CSSCRSLQMFVQYPSCQESVWRRSVLPTCHHSPPGNGVGASPLAARRLGWCAGRYRYTSVPKRSLVDRAFAIEILTPRQMSNKDRSLGSAPTRSRVWSVPGEIEMVLVSAKVFIMPIKESASAWLSTPAIHRY